MTRFHFESSKDVDLMYVMGYYIGDPYFFLETEGNQYAFLSCLDIGAFKEGSKKDVEAVDMGQIPKSTKTHNGRYPKIGTPFLKSFDNTRGYVFLQTVSAIA